MTLNEAIAKADSLRPNPFSDGEKAAFVLQLEDRLLREFDRPVSGFRYPEDGDRELDACCGYEDIYVYWLCAGIDMMLKEYGDFNNSAVVFNTMTSDYKKQKLRDEAPAPKGYKGVWRRGV